MNIGTHTSIPVSPSRSTARLCGATAPAGVGANHADLLLVGILDERHAVTAEVTELLAGCTPHGGCRHALDGGGPGRPTVALQIRTRAFVDENYPALVHVEWDHENGRCCRTHSTAMFGGNYAATSDSRLPEIAARYGCRRASVLPIHDRIETLNARPRPTRRGRVASGRKRQVNSREE
ncbi:hypothetical protein [Rhodococcus phenolicus]|uniref:hypothetical protein n=1 Tax=Rhodococcus phenolicus TaxID=263849 RepID=UPI00083631D6|nr:hypothetical protein [Rhodococcus phenolicus]